MLFPSSHVITFPSYYNYFAALYLLREYISTNKNQNMVKYD